MESRGSYEAILNEVDDQIDWMIENYRMSGWLQQALRNARDRDPVDSLNDLEILASLRKRRANAQIGRSLFRETTLEHDTDKPMQL